MINRFDKTPRMSRVVESNGTIYLAGIVSDDKTLDIKGQVTRALEIAEQRFSLAGSDKEHILMTQIFIKDIYRDFAGLNEIWDNWVSKENPPARACVEANMASEGTLVELVFTLKKP